MSTYYVEVCVKASVRVEAGSTTEAEIIAKDRLRQHTQKASTVLEVMSGNLEIGGQWCPKCCAVVDHHGYHGTIEGMHQHPFSCPACGWGGNTAIHKKALAANES